MRTPIAQATIRSIKATRLDVGVFFGSFLGAIVIYICLRILGVRQLWLTAAMIGVMLLYAALVLWTPRLRMRLDQAGDNAYYLGLLLTLASMAVALYQFGASQFGGTTSDSNAAARHIIGSFGIALGTTIAGIFLRVILHQMRVDPADIESMTRLELAEAASRTKSTLESVSSGMARHLDELQQRSADHLKHLSQQAAETLGQLVSKVSETTKQVTEDATRVQQGAAAKVAELLVELTRLIDETKAAATRLREVEPPPVKLATRLEKISQQLENLAGVVETGNARLVDTAAAGELAAEKLMNLSTAAGDALRSAEDLQRRVSAQLESSATDVSKALRSITEALEESRTDLKTLHESLSTSAEATLQSQEAANRTIDTLVRAAESLAQTVRQS